MDKRYEICALLGLHAA